MDDDAVILTTFNLTSTNSVTVLTNGLLIPYPTNAPNVADQINCTASDSYGTNVAGVVNIAVNDCVTGINGIVNIATGKPRTLNAYALIGFVLATSLSILIAFLIPLEPDPGGRIR